MRIHTVIQNASACVRIQTRPRATPLTLPKACTLIPFIHPFIHAFTEQHMRSSLLYVAFNFKRWNCCQLRRSESARMLTIAA